MQQLSGGDALFLKVELENFPMHIGGVSIYDQSTAPDGIVRFKDILRMLEGRLDQSPIFKRKLQEVPMNWDEPYWVDDDNFDIEFHVRHIALPKPGDWRQLCIQAARLHARPLDRTRPLWEIYVIEGLNNVEGVPKGSFALYTKIHHCAMDGVSGVQFFAALHELSADSVTERPPADIPACPTPSRSRMLGNAYIKGLRRSTDIMKLMGSISPTRKRIRAARESGDVLESGEVPSTRFNGPLSGHRVVDSVRYDFEAIRAIKNTLEGATVNDVVLAIVSGALRKYLSAHNELPEEPLVTGCPIDVRDESEREAGGNMIGMMSVNLNSDIDDAWERFEAVHNAAISAKNFAEVLGPRIGMDIAETVPTGIQSAIIRMSVGARLTERSAMMNTVVTNVPGSPVQLYMCGARQVDAIGMGPVLPGTGLFHTVSSFVLNKQGSITISFVACREVMPDPAFYAQCLRDSFDDLAAAALGEEALAPAAETAPA